MCFVVPVATTYIALHLQRSQAKSHAQSKIDSGIKTDDIVLLKFTDQQKNTLLHWEHDREFEYDGQMYDILKTEIKNDTNYYWCYWDRDETKIKQQQHELKDFVLGNNPNKQENQKRLLVYLKSLFYVENIALLEQLAPVVTERNLAYKPGFYSTLLPSVSSPPPERA